MFFWVLVTCRVIRHRVNNRVIRALPQFSENEPYVNVAFQKLYGVPVSSDTSCTYVDKANLTSPIEKSPLIREELLMIYKA
jgi:hypothetical protein